MTEKHLITQDKDYPIFPEVRVQKRKVKDMALIYSAASQEDEFIYQFRFSSLVRVLSEGKWYDLYQQDVYLADVEEVEAGLPIEENLKMMFMRQCVNHLTLWRGGTDLAEKHLSPNQRHHDPVIEEVISLKQEHNE